MAVMWIMQLWVLFLKNAKLTKLKINRANRWLVQTITCKIWNENNGNEN